MPARMRLPKLAAKMWAIAVSCFLTIDGAAPNWPDTNVNNVAIV